MKKHTRLFYGFSYTDGINTTTDTGGARPRLYVAGRLLAFASKAARDDWVAEGYRVPVPRSMGEFRKAVSAKALPMGWDYREAHCGEHEYMDMDHKCPACRACDTRERPERDDLY
jgi:hypothetical protein